MIGYLHGKLLEKNPPDILVDVQGVGYEVAAPMTTAYELPAVGESVMLYIHMVVREDAQLLYGFASKQARHLFRQLIKVNGIGAKIALAMMSGMESADLIHSILAGDIAMLSRIPGIGKKTAERLVVEMKDKLANSVDLLPSGSNAIQGSSIERPMRTTAQDAADALVALGYKPNEAAKVIKTLMVDKPDLETDELIRQALRQMVAR